MKRRSREITGNFVMLDIINKLIGDIFVSKSTVYFYKSLLNHDLHNFYSVQHFSSNGL